MSVRIEFPFTTKVTKSTKSGVLFIRTLFNGFIFKVFGAPEINEPGTT